MPAMDVKDAVDQNWITVYSERHRRHYYYNTLTKESTWKKPKSGSKRKQKSRRTKEKSVESNERSALSRRQRKEAAPVWTTHYDPKHRRNYYYNRSTGESTWTLPVKTESRGVEVEASIEKKNELGGLENEDRGTSAGAIKSPLTSTKIESDMAQQARQSTNQDSKFVSPPAKDNVTPVELIPSWRRYFNAKTVEDPLLPVPEPQAEPQPQSALRKMIGEQSAHTAVLGSPHHGALSRRPPTDGLLSPGADSLAEAQTPVVPTVLGKAGQPKGLGLPFLSEIKAKKAKLQTAIKDTNTEASRSSAPPGRMSFIDEIKTKLKARRESMEAEKVGTEAQQRDLERTRSEPAEDTSHSSKSTRMLLSKVKRGDPTNPTQTSILQALLSKSREFHDHSNRVDSQGMATEAREDEEWSSEEDVDGEMDSPSASQDEVAWKPQFRVTKSGTFQIQCEGDDWKDFEQDARLDELDVEEKSISEDSTTALRINRAAVITDLSNTFKQVKALERFIIRDQQVH